MGSLDPRTIESIESVTSALLQHALDNLKSYVERAEERDPKQLALFARLPASASDVPLATAAKLGTSSRARVVDLLRQIGADDWGEKVLSVPPDQIPLVVVFLFAGPPHWAVKLARMAYVPHGMTSSGGTA